MKKERERERGGERRKRKGSFDQKNSPPVTSTHLPRQGGAKNQFAQTNP